MKKILLAVLVSLYLFGMNVFATEEKIIDYSLMDALLPEKTVQIGEIRETDFDFSVPFSTGLTDEEIMY